MKVGDRDYCLAQRLVDSLREHGHLLTTAANTLEAALQQVADLERHLEMSRDGGGRLWDKLEAMQERAETAEINLATARERIAELERRLLPDSAAGLGNEFKAWDAASDEALSRFEEGLEGRG